MARWLVSTLLIGCVTLGFAAAPVGAQEGAGERMANWPHWRGPLATGVAPRGNPPTEWSQEKNIKWKVALPGRGNASPIVWGDKIFIATAIKTDRMADQPDATASRQGASGAVRQTAYIEGSSGARSGAQLLAQRGEGRGREGRGGGGEAGGNRWGIVTPTHYHQFVVMCLDRRTGKTVWQKTATEAVPHEGHHPTASFASSSPVTDGENLYVSFGSRGIYSYDLDGNFRWRKDLGKMETANSFGEGSSPVLQGNVLVVQWDHDAGSFITALDTSNGETKWKQPREEDTTWATPLVVPYGGGMQVVASGSNKMRAYDLETGKILWECAGLGSNAIPSPVAIDGLVICMTGFREYAAYAIPVNSTGELTAEDAAWKLDDGTPYIASPVLYDGVLYFTKSRNAILSSADAKTGEVIINQRRLPGMDTLYAAPVAAAGRIYFSSREGTTVVVGHSRDVEVLATNELDEVIDATPAIVGDELLIRTENHLYCIAESGS